MIFTSSFCVSIASLLGVGTGSGRSLTKGLMSSSSGRGFDEPDPTLWKLLDDCRTAISPWTENVENLGRNIRLVFISPEPGHLGRPVLGDGEEVRDGLAPFGVHRGLLHGLLQLHPLHHCGGCPRWGWARRCHFACSPCSRPWGPLLQAHPPTTSLKIVFLLLDRISDLKMRMMVSSQFHHLNGNPWGLFTSLSEILSDWSRWAAGTREILIERETSKLMEQRRRLERSIEEESLQMRMIIMWRRWSFVMNSHFKSCFQLRWMSSTLWRKLNS